MTSRTTTLTQGAGKLERFPDFPPREDMQNTSHLHRRSILTALAIHIGNPETTLVHGEVPVAPTLDPWGAYRIPDLIVVHDCDVALVDEQGGYAIDRQGKAPDFVLEVASRSTGEVDYTDKRRDYERFGIGEYWRFDPSGGEYHDAALAGDLLVDGVYEPIEIEDLGEGRLRGYSDVLGLYVCWEEGMLRFFDPLTESYLRSHDEDTARATSAEVRAEEERSARLTAQARAAAAEARAAELEAELRRLRGE
ncbi:MAG: Uma2 family endonuclease [Chloroflexi bacterium]|nr:Uma2 family endonuclease [Chloroflexota bacterium]